MKPGPAISGGWAMSAELDPVDEVLGEVAGWPARLLGQRHRPVDLVVGPVRAADDGVGAPQRLVQRRQGAGEALAQYDARIGHGPTVPRPPEPRHRRPGTERCEWRYRMFQMWLSGHLLAKGTQVQGGGHAPSIPLPVGRGHRGAAGDLAGAGGGLDGSGQESGADQATTSTSSDPGDPGDSGDPADSGDQAGSGDQAPGQGRIRRPTAPARTVRTATRRPDPGRAHGGQRSSSVCDPPETEQDPAPQAGDAAQTYEAGEAGQRRPRTALATASSGWPGPPPTTAGPSRWPPPPGPGSR